MPVRKFRSIQETKAHELKAGDPQNIAIACEITEVAYALRPWRFPAGVYKFRSIEEAQAHRLAWVHRNVRRPTPSTPT